MRKRALGLALFLGLVLAAVPVTPVAVPDFGARGVAPAPDRALAFELRFSGPVEVILARYLDGREAGRTRSTGEGPAVAVFGYGASERCPLLLVGAVFREQGASSGGACAGSGPDSEVRLLPTLPDRIESGAPCPVA